MREIKTEGKHILINGQPTFLRGTLECAIFPKTGYPPTDVDAWLRIFRICRAHGLNHLRFHSWCPPEAAFEAADQSGFTCMSNVRRGQTSRPPWAMENRSTHICTTKANAWSKPIGNIRRFA
jgi:hypothetical protein